jgi:hypothetical protein
VGGDEGEEAGGETNEAKTETNDAKPETTTQAADTSDLLTELDSALAACTLLSRVGKHEEEFRARTRDEVLKLEISNRCDAHRLKLKAAAGKTGNKQGTLAGAT